jgi:hypothetical protein
MVKKIDVPCWSYREAALIALLAEISLWLGHRLTRLSAASVAWGVFEPSVRLSVASDVTGVAVTSCSLIEIQRRFEGFSEDFYRSTWSILLTENSSYTQTVSVRLSVTVMFTCWGCPRMFLYSTV